MPISPIQPRSCEEKPLTKSPHPLDHVDPLIQHLATRVSRLTEKNKKLQEAVKELLMHLPCKFTHRIKKYSELSLAETEIVRIHFQAAFAQAHQQGYSFPHKTLKPFYVSCATNPHERYTHVKLVVQQATPLYDKYAPLL